AVGSWFRRWREVAPDRGDLVGARSPDRAPSADRRSHRGCRETCGRRPWPGPETRPQPGWFLVSSLVGTGRTSGRAAPYRSDREDANRQRTLPAGPWRTPTNARLPCCLLFQAGRPMMNRTLSTRTCVWEQETLAPARVPSWGWRSRTTGIRSP